MMKPKRIHYHKMRTSSQGFNATYKPIAFKTAERKALRRDFRTSFFSGKAVHLHLPGEAVVEIEALRVRQLLSGLTLAPHASPLPNRPKIFRSLLPYSWVTPDCQSVGHISKLPNWLYAQKRNKVGRLAQVTPNLCVYTYQRIDTALFLGLRLVIRAVEIRLAQNKNTKHKTQNTKHKTQKQKK